MAGRQLADALLGANVTEFLEFAGSNMGQQVTTEQVSVARGR
jgi:hypothetical protein